MRTVFVALAALCLAGCGGPPASLVGGIPFSQSTSSGFNSRGAAVDEDVALSRAAGIAKGQDRGRSNFSGITVDAHWVRYDTHDFLFVTDRSSKGGAFSGSLDQSDNIGTGAAAATGCKTERVIRDGTTNNYTAVMACS